MLEIESSSSFHRYLLLLLLLRAWLISISFTCLYVNERWMGFSLILYYMHHQHHGAQERSKEARSAAIGATLCRSSSRDELIGLSPIMRDRYASIPYRVCQAKDILFNDSAFNCASVRAANTERGCDLISICLEVYAQGSRASFLASIHGLSQCARWV